MPTAGYKQEPETDVLAAIPLESSPTHCGRQLQGTQTSTSLESPAEKRLPTLTDEHAGTTPLQSSTSLYLPPQITTYPRSLIRQPPYPHTTVADYQATDARMNLLAAHPLSKMTLSSDI